MNQEKSFDLETAEDLLNKLMKDFDALQRASRAEVSSIAFNCVMSAWHLSDWNFEEKAKDPSNTKRKEYQGQLTAEHLFLRIMSDLANRAKHVRLTSPDVRVADSRIHGGSYSNDFSRDYDVMRLIVVMDDGSEHDFEDELGKAISFWKEELRRPEI